MLIELSSFDYEVKPIKFGYVNENRPFINGFLDVLPIGVLSSEGFAFQSELSAVWDFNQNFNSINILTDNRYNFSNGLTDPLLTVFTEDIPNMADTSPMPKFNYWLTFPKKSFIIDDEYTKFTGNLIPLKNNFTEDELIHCGSNFRNYHRLNFGEFGIDNYKPQLLYGTTKETIFSDKDKFTFNIPDYSDPIALSSLDFVCFGSIYGNDPEYSDYIEWGDDMRTWLSGNENGETIWVDRFFGLGVELVDTLLDSEYSNIPIFNRPDGVSVFNRPDGVSIYFRSEDESEYFEFSSALSSFPELESVLFIDMYPSALTLVSGEEYTYHRSTNYRNNNASNFSQQTEVIDNFSYCSDIDEYLVSYREGGQYVYNRPESDFVYLGPDGESLFIRPKDESENDPNIIPKDNCGLGCFVFMSDSGLNSDKQLDVAELVYSMGFLDGLFFGGNTNYPDGLEATIEDNWAVFEPYIGYEKVFPALGEYEVQTDPLALPHTDKFKYLPNNSRYYNIFFEGANLELFVLNSGVNSDGNLVEPDGNSVKSKQYNWFIDKLNKSTAKYRVVMFHHPYVTSKPDSFFEVVNEMDWGFDQLGIDLILNGSTRTNQHLIHNGMHILDISTPVFAPEDTSCSGTLFGQITGVNIEWVDGYPCEPGSPSIARLVATPSSLAVFVVNIETKEVSHQFIIKNDRGNINKKIVEKNKYGLIFDLGGVEDGVLIDNSGNNNNAKQII